MKKNLLVTLADKNYIQQAKQLFSSVYFNAGWQKDYMLLVYDIPEEDLQWFRDKGILIKKCQGLHQGEIGDRPAVVVSKSYLFTPEFKQWQNIIYLDADIIVRASLDELANVKGFFAVPDILENKIFSQIIDKQKQKEKSIDQKQFNQTIKKLKQEYNLNSLSFNTGVLAFSSDIIKQDSFSRLIKLFDQYSKISAYGEQLIFNLFFYEKWNKLPPIYNVYLINEKNQWQIKPENIKGKIIHFVAPDKPWITKNYFYQEWKHNLDRADLIDLKNLKPGKIWKKITIKALSIYLKSRYLVYSIMNKFFEKLSKLHHKTKQNRKNLLVTLADKSYIKQAKQLFSSVYFNAGWQGDYMLLAHDIPEEDLKWFRDKGILIKKCQPLYQGEVGGMSAVLTSKFYLFTPEFEKWDNIIYLDADIIVKASLDELTKVDGFAAACDTCNKKIYRQIIDEEEAKKRSIDFEKFKKLKLELKNNYNLSEHSFNAGVFVFNTKIIEKDTFSNLNNTVKRYQKISLHGDQLAFNLFFYRKWNKLSPIYNMYVSGEKNQWYLKPKNIKGVVLHFITSIKPWVAKNYFYQEWKENFAKANQINLMNIPEGKKWTRTRIVIYSLYLKIRFYILSMMDKNLGKVGIFLSHKWPSLYQLVKNK